MKITIYAIAMLTGFTLVTTRAAEAIYQSDFDHEMAQWQGRPGFEQWQKPELALSSNDAKEKGKNVLQVETDGRLGTGITLKPVVQVKEGNDYVLSFYLRTAAALPVTFRLIDIERKGIPNESKRNHAPESNGDWVHVEFEFTATTTPIGVEIAAGVSKYDPTTLAIYDLT